MKNLSALTGLRFIAAFYVFIFHIDLRTQFSSLPWYLQNIIDQGRLGVNLFFVLSGFILTYSYYEKAKDGIPFKEFLSKRFARIYPALIVGLLCSLIISIIIKNYVSPIVLILDTILLNSFIPQLSMVWYGSGSWSVSTEFFFYILFPFLLPYFNRINNNRIIWMMLAIFIVLTAVPGVLYFLYSTSVSLSLIYTFPLARISEFICGILAGLLVFKFKWVAKEWMVIGMISIAAFYVMFIGARFNIIMNNIAIVPSIVVILSGLTNCEKSRLFRHLGSKPMEYLGKISYSFYIIQLPILILSDHLIQKNIISLNPFLFFILALFANLLLSIMLYHFVEHPAHTYLNKKIKQRSTQKSPTNFKPLLQKVC